MKKLSIILLSAFMYSAVWAQTVTIRFEGAANAKSKAAKNYSVDVDGKRYYSADAVGAGNAAAKQLVIDNLSLGTHNLAVNEVRTNNSNIQLYSNSFKLRSGYDMVIAVRRNGQVAFTEKKATAGSGNLGSTTSYPALSNAEFDKLVQSVKGRWAQSSRITALRTAFNDKANYFTTDQVGQLLMLVTSEASRLELAKLAYPQVTDAANYNDVTELLSSQASKDNLRDYILAKSEESIIINPGGSRTPLTTQQFNQLLRQVKNQYRQEGKYAVLQDAFNAGNSYFTTAQLRQLLPLITNESERLALAKLSYSRVSDQSGFASLYDLFTTQANRDELKNYVSYGDSGIPSGQYSNRVAMADNEFSRLQMKARLHIRQSSTVADVKAAFANSSNYFSLEQIRSMLSLVTAEADRLALAKLAWHRITDPSAFTQLFDMFTQTNANNLNTYIRSNPS